MMRSSHRGSHHAASPSRCIRAGISSSRTTNASSSTPKARPKPIGRIIASSAKMKPPNTEIMMIAAAITTARPERRPDSTAWRAGRPCA